MFYENMGFIHISVKNRIISFRSTIRFNYKLDVSLELRMFVIFHNKWFLVTAKECKIERFNKLARLVSLLLTSHQQTI